MRNRYLTRLFGLVAILLAVSLVGCGRSFYRNQADKEVGDILLHTPQDPRWKLENFHIYPDSRSRFADPTNPDRPPMPPDDPVAHLNAPIPQKPGKSGIALVEGTGYLDLLAQWNLENRAQIEQDKKKEKEAKESEANARGQDTEEIIQVSMLGAPVPVREGEPLEELPAPNAVDQEAAPSDPRARYTDPLTRRTGPEPYLMNLDQALTMALLNSREFQDRREDVYLQALPVSVERFAFTSQFFALEEIIRERTGSLTPEGARNRWITNSNLGFTKLFSRGGLLLFQFANSTVVEMLGAFDPDVISTSRINLDLIQPLLRGGGRAVTLEPLTLVERNLLYELRDFARFRKQFYVSIATGAGLSGSSIGATRFRNRPQTFRSGGGIPGADLGPGSGGISGLPSSTSVGGGSSGYLATTVAAALLENERKNVASLERFLVQYRYYEEGGQVSQLQVDQVEQQLLRSRNAVFAREQTLLDQLDQFKIQLGIPVTIPISLSSEPLHPQTEHLQLFEQLITDFNATREEVSGLAELATPLGLRARLRTIATTSALVRDTKFSEEFAKRWKIWEARSLDELREKRLDLQRKRRELLDELVDEEIKGNKPTEEQLDRILQDEFEISLSELEEALRQYEAIATQPIGAIFGMANAGPLQALLTGTVRPEKFSRIQALRFRAVFNSFIILLLEARNQRLFLIKEGWPKFPPILVEGTDLTKVDLAEAEELVVRTALTQRLDLMNERAQLMDAWRQIAIAANSLLGTFNVEYHLRSDTPPGLAHPFAFSGSRTRHQLTFNLELPLVRILERNSYRASLIAWQRRRRLLMLTEDAIANGIRQTIRDLRVQTENYEIQKRAVELAYLQVENAGDVLREPAAPGSQVSAGSSAALTQQLLNAQRSLLSEQNDLINLWVQYLSNRMGLYRDLEIMQIDSRGIWINDIANQNSTYPDGASEDHSATRE